MSVDLSDRMNVYQDVCLSTYLQISYLPTHLYAQLFVCLNKKNIISTINVYLYIPTRKRKH